MPACCDAARGAPLGGRDAVSPSGAQAIEDGGRFGDGAPPLLPWAERPWHNIQESVLNILRHFVDCLRRGAEPETSGADNLKTLALVHAAYASAAQGSRTVTL